jgi:hypothetical protein
MQVTRLVERDCSVEVPAWEKTDVSKEPSLTWLTLAHFRGEDTLWSIYDKELELNLRHLELNDLKVFFTLNFASIALQCRRRCEHRPTFRVV